MPPAVLVLALLMSAPPPPPSVEALREAEIQAAKAIASWEAKSFVRAAEYFLAAFELSGEPTQLRNAAKAFEAAGAREDAHASWVRFLELSALSAEDRSDAEERVRALAPEREAEVETETAPIVEAYVEPPPPLAPPTRWEPWVLVGAGAGAAIAGGVLWGVAAGDLTDLRARIAVQQDGKIVGIERSTALAEKRRIEGMRIGGALAIGAGIAAVLAGLSWWWFEW